MPEKYEAVTIKSQIEGCFFTLFQRSPKLFSENFKLNKRKHRVYASEVQKVEISSFCIIQGH